MVTQLCATRRARRVSTEFLNASLSACRVQLSHCTIAISLVLLFSLSLIALLTLVLVLILGICTITSFNSVPYGQVSRSFALRWKDELEHIWPLLDSNDNMYSVTYNQDRVNPTLLARWTKLRHFYGLTANHQVTMTYFGQSAFFLTIFKSISEPKTYPKWHSLKTTKIGNGWRTFAQLQNLQAGTQIIICNF
ncbi:hypothetical protein GmHk_06G017444 [Glycine max]|nr:hypothetical protein GmHk_06G017444 [Glycine max]